MLEEIPVKTSEKLVVRDARERKSWNYEGKTSVIRQKGESWVFQENKARTCAYQGVRNFRFSENLVSFVFLKQPFWNSPFWLITDENSPFSYAIGIDSGRSSDYHFTNNGVLRKNSANNLYSVGQFLEINIIIFR